MLQSRKKEEPIVKKRHYSIIKDLLNSPKPITASELAKRNKVSLRTIRNDMKEVEEIVNHYNGVLVSIPGTGMKIHHMDTNHSELKKYFSAKEFIEFSDEERCCIVAYYFMLSQGHVPSRVLADFFEISQTLILNIIKQTNDKLKDHQMTILGEKKKGFIFQAAPRSCLSFINQKKLIFENENVFAFIMKLSPQMDMTLEKVNSISESLFAEAAIKVIDLELFTLQLLYLTRLDSKKERGMNTLTKIDLKSVKINHIFQIIERMLSTKIDTTLYSYYVFVFSTYTNFSDKVLYVNEDELSQAIDSFVLEFEKYFGKIDVNVMGLKKDLAVHIKTLIEKSTLDIFETNPLLNNIKATYFELFQAVKQSIFVLENSLDTNFNDDEIGYIVLYFAKCYEKQSKFTRLKTLVVCNTGRGSAKLLSSRIKNNIPELEISEVYSLSQFYNNDTSDIDLIISTVHIDQATIPSIVVSPLLNAQEIQQIRGIIYSLNPTMKGISRSNEHTEQLVIYQSFSESETYAVVVLEIVSMFQEYNLPEKYFEKLTGILTHTIMSIPRWKETVYVTVSEGEYETFMENYEEYMTITQKYLDRLAALLDVYIPTNEVIPIVRYLL